MAKTITITEELEDRMYETLIRVDLEYWIYETDAPWEYCEDIKVVAELFNLLGYDMAEYIDDYEDRLKEDAKEVEEYEKFLKVNVHLR